MARDGLISMLVMVGLLQGVGDVEHRQPAMTDPPQANLQNSPDTTWSEGSAYGKTQLTRPPCQLGSRHNARHLSSRHQVRCSLGKEEPQKRRYNCQPNLEP